MSIDSIEPIAEDNLDGYGAPLIPWVGVRELLEAGWSQRPGSGGPDRHTCWLATVRPDGRPHVTALGARWVDGAFYFTAGASTRKARNIADNPHCAITVALDTVDLVAEGEAATVTDAAKVRRIGEMYESSGWQTALSHDALVISGEFSAPSAGPPPWHVFEVVPAKIVAVGMVEPYGATRWHFQ